MIILSFFELFPEMVAIGMLNNSHKFWEIYVINVLGGIYIGSLKCHFYLKFLY